MLLEHELVPYSNSLPTGNRIIVLAPHPDDETFGCGGAILQLVEMKKDIKVIFLTSGDKADPNHKANKIIHDKMHITDYSLMREDEAKKALYVLSVTDYVFLRYPDRELHLYYNQIYEQLKGLINDYRPDTIYSPSPIELNPDHRTCAQLSLALQNSFKIAFYEVTSPLRPNQLVDITNYYDKKMTALSQYNSQIGLIDYSYYISALNRFRALTVSKTYCEAYWLLEGKNSDDSICRWLCYKSSIK